MKFKDLEYNKEASLNCLLKNADVRQTKKGDDYLILTLLDSNRDDEGNFSPSQEIMAKLWEHNLENFPYEPGTVLAVKIRKQQYQENDNYIALEVNPAAADVSDSDFLVAAPYKGEDMFNAILSSLEKKLPTGEGALADLCKKIYEKNREKLLIWSAAKSVHHDFKCGLLYHTYRMLWAACQLAQIYPVVDKELLLVGIALHDIGKIVELDTDVLGIASYTLEGDALGHALLGIEMIDREVFENPGLYDETRILALKQIIASHHGKAEWGAIKSPMDATAIMVHLIDMIDSRMNICEKAYQQMEAGEITDSTNFVLGSKLIKW